MIALLSALFGFISSATPDLLKLFTDARDRAHEVAVLQLQLEHERAMSAARGSEDTAERDAKMEAVAAQAAQAQESLLNARLKEQMTGIHWVDALAGSVRPVLTYSFFLLYALVKAAQFHLLIQPLLPWSQSLSLPQALVMVWGEEDTAIFSAIMAFWFGSRAMRKGRA